MASDISLLLRPRLTGCVTLFPIVALMRPNARIIVVNMNFSLLARFDFASITCGFRALTKSSIFRKCSRP